MRDFSIIYGLSRFPVYFATHFFYKRVLVRQPRNLPFRGPVLICSNHTNAFMDPALVASEMWRQIYSLARGDAFKGKLVTWILKRYKINPIFRLSEGMENLHKNEQTFIRSFEILERKNSLIMYPEGICIQEKRLRKLKKGAARIAFGVEERNNFKLNLTILPVVLNYSDPKKFRSTLFIHFGKPFHAAMFKELYLKDKVRAINEFTKYLEDEMAGLMVIVADKANDELFEQILLLYKSDVIKKHHWNHKDMYHDYLASKLIADKLNEFSRSHSEKTNALRLISSSYFKKLEQYQLRDHLLRNNVVNKSGLFNVIFDALVLVVGFPLHLVGLALNYLPYRIAYETANKLARNIEFHASVNIAVGMIVWILYYIFQLVVVAKFSHSWTVLLAVAIIIPLTGVCSVHFYSVMKKIIGKWRLIRLSKKDPGGYSELQALRKQAVNELQALRLNE